MFYLMMYSTHLVQSYMASDIVILVLSEVYVFLKSANSVEYFSIKMKTEFKKK